MTIFNRLGTLLKSNVNDAINKAEDPEKMLNQMLLDMQQQLVEAKKQVAVAIADVQMACSGTSMPLALSRARRSRAV